MVKPETAGVYEGAEVYEGAVDYEGAEVYEDEPGTDLREAECAASSLDELRAARAAAGQSAGKRGLRSRAEGHAVCAGWRPHEPPAVGPVRLRACQNRDQGQRD